MIFAPELYYEVDFSKAPDFLQQELFQSGCLGTFIEFMISCKKVVAFAVETSPGRNEKSEAFSYSYFGTTLDSRHKFPFIEIVAVSLIERKGGR